LNLHGAGALIWTTRITSLEVAQAKMGASFEEHVKSCEKRAARMERALWLVVAGVATLLYHFLAPKLGLGS
jgi:hypothetical protein